MPTRIVNGSETLWLEIVTYQVNSVPEADAERQGAREIASGLPGFSGWLPLADA